MGGKQTIHLPVFQRFDCHSCGYCCRNLVVNVTDTERHRILEAGWEQRIGDRPLFVAYRFRGRQLYRLAHQPDGACVLLGENGLCRLHAETGVHIKPLACRLYPFVPTPGAESVRLDLRADCPSVAANQGRSLHVHQQAIGQFAEETVTRPMRILPAWGGERPLTVQEFEAVVSAFEGLLSRTPLSLRGRLRAGTILLDLLYAARISKVRDERFVEMMDLLAQAVVQEAQSDEQQRPGLSLRPGRLFRQWLFLHAIADDPADLEAGRLQRWRRSWTRYRQSRRFVEASGPIPPLRPDWPPTEFEAVDRVDRGDDADLEPLIRSMRVKLEAHAFCGPGYYGYDLLAGLTALWLLPAVVGWFARLAAVAAGRSVLSADDLMAGLHRAHHTFGVSPVFARISERLRLKALARPGIAGRLLDRYGP